MTGRLELHIKGKLNTSREVGSWHDVDKLTEQFKLLAVNEDVWEIALVIEADFSKANFNRKTEQRTNIYLKSLGK